MYRMLEYPGQLLIGILASIIAGLILLYFVG